MERTQKENRDFHPPEGRGFRYVVLDPTGNLTCLVLDPVAEADRAEVTVRLLNRCEQVGYLVPASDARARARLQMMGGEFCGNATMGTAAFLAERDGLPEGAEKEILLEVSGAGRPLPCRVRREKNGWQGTVAMPRATDIRKIRIGGRNLTAVTMPGIVHLITEERLLDRADAEGLIREAAGQLAEAAIGLLQWEEEKQRMTPLVFVRSAGSLVWETACGSGTAAIAAWKAAEAGANRRVDVRQPGGVLTAEAEVERTGKPGTELKIREIRLTGRIRIGTVEIIGQEPC